MKQKTTILDQLKAEIRKAERRGITRYRLAQLSDVTQATLSRIVNGKLPKPRLETAEKLAEALGLHVVLTRKR